jgi:CRISPR-associated protein Cmr6
MARAAIPAYLGHDFSTASPGLRFGMYLKLWGEDRRSNELLWSTHDIAYEVRGQSRQERGVKYENKTSALQDARRLNPGEEKAMAALAARQSSTFENSVPATARISLDAVTVAPFTTGLGNEHPLENGFAFLNPYGLPYLPGSGIKGVLRQAARELCEGDWGDTQGWTEQAVTALFGKEPKDGDSEHQRGALTFWDVIPQIKGNQLDVEIMTPHYSHYYQPKRDDQSGKSASPHDSGTPTPITFLTVPPGSGFSFHVQCDLALLAHTAAELAQDARWKPLLQAAFEHAFAWCGFGAKTAVGYGVMAEDPAKKIERQQKEEARQEALRRQQEREARAADIARMDPVDQAIARFLDARADKNQPESNALLTGLKSNVWSGDLMTSIARKLKGRMQAEKKWKERSEKKNPEKDKDYLNTQLVMKYLKDDQP